MCGDPFQFDEATNTKDWYIQKVKEVAALLDYGDPQNSRVIHKHFA